MFLHNFGRRVQNQYAMIKCYVTPAKRNEAYVSLVTSEVLRINITVIGNYVTLHGLMRYCERRYFRVYKFSRIYEIGQFRVY